MINVQTLPKYIFILSLYAMCLALIPSQGSAQGVMRIAAVVNDDIISAHDLSQRIRLTIATTRMKDTPEVRKRLTSRILKLMIDERLKIQEGERLGIKITDEKIESGLNRYALSLKIQPEKFGQALSQMRVDPEVLRDQARAEISWASAIQRTGRERLLVSDNEIESAMAAIEANKGKPEYLYSEIFLPVESPSQESNVRELVNRLIGHIQNGSPFAALARDFSQSTSAVRGGDLGWVQSGSVPKEIENSLSQIPINEYSSPVRTISGIYLLHLRDKRISGQDEQDEILSVSQAIIPLAKDIKPDEMAAKRGLANTLSYQAQTCDQFDEMAKKISTSKSGRVDNLKLSQMPPMLRPTVAPLGKGQIGVNEQKDALIVLMVCEREKTTPMPEVAKRKIIKKKLRMERLGREDRRLMQKLRRDAFVDIRL